MESCKWQLEDRQVETALEVQLNLRLIKLIYLEVSSRFA